jgi:hypothetical protein
MLQILRPLRNRRTFSLFLNEIRLGAHGRALPATDSISSRLSTSRPKYPFHQKQRRVWSPIPLPFIPLPFDSF